MMSTVEDCQLIQLRKISSAKGSITPLEGNKDLPFEIRRVYYLYDVPGGESRAGHAHKQLEQLFVSVSGALDVVLDDGSKKKTFTLNRGYFGLYVPKMIWREVVNFSSGTVCLVLASRGYNESDYIRDYQEFLNVANSENDSQTCSC